MKESQFEAANKAMMIAKEVSAKNYEIESMHRLMTILEKKFKTSFIGAISQFESYFGVLWGHGKPENKLTEQEKLWRERWNLVRTQILNNGNNQVRAVQQELSQYTMRWDAHSIKLISLPPVENKG